MLNFPRWKIVIIVLVCLAAIVTSLPNFLTSDIRSSLPGWMPSDTVNLGLDLRGGSYLLLEVDFDTYLKEQLELLVDDVRSTLREKKIDYIGLDVKGRGTEGYVGFSVKDQAQVNEASSLLSSTLKDASVNVETGGVATLRYDEDALTKMRQNVLTQSIEIVRRRVDETGTREPIIQRQGDTRVLLQVPGLQDPEHLKNLLGKTAKMTFHLLGDEKTYGSKARRVSPGTKWVPGSSRDEQTTYYLIKKKVELSGDLLVDSRATYNQGMPVVSFRFNTLGGKKFSKITKENTNKRFAIVLDGEAISVPVIRGHISGGSGIIEGGFTVQSANDLALLLRAGALPAPLSIIEERTVGPSLGQDSIDAGKMAAVAGILLVIGLMIVFYGLFGIFSVVALVMNMFLILAALTLFQATLTLPGIAGIVLTMGMAVDANVLIFERIREELRVGKTPFAAIEHGFRLAFKTIIDSNLTTLMATLLLFLYGSGPVKGFAVTLSIGILASMFSAILLTRMLVVVWLKRTKPSMVPI